MSKTYSLEEEQSLGVVRRLTYSIAPGVLLAGVAGGIAFPILPIVGVKVGLPLWFIGVILAGNRATRVLSSPFVGILTDHIGGRRTLLLGLSIQLIVMALYWLGMVVSKPGLFFLVSRLLHGPGSACVFVGAQTLAMHAGGRAHGGKASSIVRASMSAGMPIGLAAGGLLAVTVGEERTFLLALAAIAAGLIASYLTVPDLKMKAKKRESWMSVWKLLADTRILSIGSLNFAMFFSAQGIVLTTIVLLVHSRGLHAGGLGDQGTAGLAMGLMVIISSMSMITAGRLGDRYRTHARIALSGIIITIPGLLIVGFGHSLAIITSGVAVVGIGSGALGPSVLALLADRIEPEQRGRGVGALQLCGDIGGVLGPIIGTTLVVYGAVTPYLCAAVVLMLVIPIAMRLVRFEQNSMPPAHRKGKLTK
jgi:MFS family permease